MTDIAGNTFYTALDLELLTNVPKVIRNEEVGALEGADIDYDDYYRFQLEGNSAVDFKLSGLNSNAQLYLYDNDGISAIASSTNADNTDESISHNLRAGTYYLRVYSSYTTTYKLEAFAVSLGPVPEDKAGDSPIKAKDLGILKEESVASDDFIGDFSGISQDSQDYYKFELLGDSSVNIKLSGLSDNAQLYLYENDGSSSLGYSFNSGTDDEVISRDLRAGTYYLQVSGNSATTYRVEASARPVQAAIQSRFNSATDLGVIGKIIKSREDTLDDGNSFDYYKLQVSEDSTLDIKLSGLAGSAYLELYRSNGNSLFASAYNPSSPETVINRQASAGTYYLIVGSGSGGGSETHYQLETSATSLGLAPNDNAGERIDTAKDLGVLGRDRITANDFIGKFSDLSQDDRDYYKFEVTENSAFNIKLSGFSQNIGIQLYNNDGSRQLASAYSDVSASTAINRNLRAGTYYLMITGGSSQGTSYQLEASAIAAGTYQDDAGNTIETARDIGVLDGARTFDDFIGSYYGEVEDYSDLYRFVLEKSSKVNFAFSAESADASSYLRLLDSQGRSADSYSDGVDSLEKFLTAGTYYLQVSPRSSSTKYRLTANGTPIDDLAGNSIDNARDIGVLSGTRNISDFVGSIDYTDIYRLEIKEDSRLNLDILAQTEETKVAIALLDNNGRQLDAAYTGIERDLVAGTYYVYVIGGNSNYVSDGVTNYYSSGNTNYDITFAATALGQQLPDLVVSDIVAPATVSAGETIELVWTVTNHGAEDAKGTWTDTVYLSDDENAGSDQTYGSFAFTGEIKAGKSIERRQTVTLAENLKGNRYFVVRTDANNQLLEGDNEENNATIDAEAISVNHAKLEVTKVEVVGTAASSEEVVVKWTVVNSGTSAVTNSYWYDNVWLSTDSQLSQYYSDISLGQVSLNQPLGVGESYSQELTVKIPQGTEGVYYFLVKADASDRINNFQGEVINSLGVSELTIVSLTPPPDLQVTVVDAPTQGTAEQTVSITWTVTNEGAGKTLQDDWYDSVYISTDKSVDGSDYLLAVERHIGALESGQSYEVTKEITLPQGISGDYHFLVRTDFYNQVFEGALSENNTGEDATPTTISLIPPADLKVETVTLPANAEAGEALNISYRVTNTGETDASTDPWVDIFYLSQSSSLDLSAAVYLGSATHSGGLRAGKAYENSVNFALGAQLSGEYFVVVLTDYNNNVFELNNSNNIASSAASVMVTAQIADLQVSNLTLAEGVEAGVPTQVEWTVENKGTGRTLTDSWRDRIILSTDAVLGNADDIQLAEVARTGVLAVGDTYTQQATVEVPFETEGSYSLFVVADAAGNVQESVEGNNSAVQAITVNRKTPDLQVVEVSSESATKAVGESLTVNWTVKNAGSGNTNSDSWYDHVYLSTDNVLGDNDIYLGRVRRTAVLDAGKEYTASRTFTIPVNAVGNFYTIVRTDAENSVLEGAGEGNNDGVSAITLRFSEQPVSPATLTLEVERENVNEGSGTFEATITRSDNIAKSIIVTLDSNATSQVSFPPTVTIASGQSSVSFDVAILNDDLVEASQVVNLTADSVGFSQGSASFNLVDDDSPTLSLTFSAAEAVEGSAVEVTIRRNTDVNETLAVNLSSNDDAQLIIPPNIFIPVGAESVTVSLGVVDDVRIEDLQSLTVTGTATGFSSGTAVLSIVDNDDVTLSLSLNATAIGEGAGTAAVVGTVTRDIVSDQDLIVDLSSSDVSEATIPATVTILAGQESANFSLDAVDDLVVDGDQSVIITARPSDANSFPVSQEQSAAVELKVTDDDVAALSVSVDRDMLVEGGSAIATVTRNSSLDQGLDVNLTSSDTSEASIPGSVTLAAGQSSATFVVTGVNDNIADGDQLVTFLAEAAGFNAGTTQLEVIDAGVERLTPKLVIDSKKLTGGMLRGAQKFVEFEISNEGSAATGDIDVLLPDAPWLSLTSPGKVSSLAPSESKTITLQLTPDADLDLVKHTGRLFLDAAEDAADTSVDFSFTATSDATGSVKINAVDELFYFTEAAPGLRDAKVSIRDYFTGQLIQTEVTDEAGKLSIDGLAEGYYSVEIRSKNHETYRNNLKIEAGETSLVEAFLSLQTVRTSWNVKQVGIEDRYEITVESEFDANVPVPTVIIEPDVIDLYGLDTIGKSTQIDMVVTNHGLIAADNLSLSLFEHPFYKVESLIEDLGSLSAKSSLTVSVRITRISDFDNLSTLSLSSNNKGTHSANTPYIPCVSSIGVEFSYDCGGRTIERAVPKAVVNLDGSCFDTSTTVQDLYQSFKDRQDSRDFGGANETSAAGGGSSTYPAYPLIKIDPPGCNPCVEEGKQFLGDVALAVVGITAGAVLGPTAGAVAAVALTGLGILKGLANQNNKGLGTAIAGGALSGLGAKNAKGIFVAGALGAASDIAGNSLTAIALGDGAADRIKNGCLPVSNNSLLSQSSKIYSSTISDLIGESVAQVLEYISRMKDEIEPFLVLFPEEIWFKDSGTESSLALYNWVEAFGKTLGDLSSNNLQITDVERTELLGTTRPSDVTASDVILFIERWNRSVTYWDEGKVYSTDLVEDENTDFIALDQLITAYETAIAALTKTQEEGFLNVQEGLDYAIKDLESILKSDSSVCAKVIIGIDQSAVMTRSAFIGTLEIENSSEISNLEDLSIVIEVRDTEGNLANSLFGFNTPILEGLNAINGTGILNSGLTGSAEFSIVPTKLAAADEPTDYTISGTLSYTENGNRVTVPLYSPPITVFPQAELHIDYFHQREVFADDPFTDFVEPSIPYNLGVLVRNEGKGDAENLEIKSSQPKIVDNEKGLLANFEIIGAQVGNKAVEPTLTANFGDIAAGKTQVANWLLKSSIQGKFVDYSATFEHVNSLGNAELSLIESVNIHELTHLVRAEVPSDDGLFDFLVNDKFDVNFAPDKIYFSDGGTADVNALLDAFADGPISITDLEAAVTANLTEAGWTYLKLDDPGNGQFEIKRVLRADGSEVSLDNVWRTDRTFPASGRPVYENKLHLFDYSSIVGETTYTVIYDSSDSIAPLILDILDVSPDPRNTVVDSIDILFSEALNLATFDYSDLKLTLNGGTNLITGSTTVEQLQLNSFRINGLAELTNNVGTYSFSADATGIEDLAGNSGVAGLSESWIFTGDKPAIASLIGIDSNNRNEPVETIRLIFTKEIDPESFDFTDILLTRDNGENLSNTSLTFTRVNSTTYEIGNLGSVTSIDGNYQLFINANGVKDIDGNSGAGGSGFNWTLDTEQLNITSITGIQRKLRRTPVQSFAVSFNKAIDETTLDLNDFVLTLNAADSAVSSSVNLIPSTATITKLNESTYKIAGLTSIQTVDGEYTLTVKLGAIQDLAGNTVAVAATESWTLDKTVPAAISNITISPDAGIDTADLMTNTRNLTISGVLPEPGLSVVLFDKTNNTQLGQATVSDTTFSLETALAAAGRRAIEVQITDAAGNTASSTFNVFIDEAKPTITDLTTKLLRTTNAIEFFDVNFSENINLETFNYADLTLTRDDGENLITEGVAITALSNNTYRISGLEALTTTPGRYVLEVNSPGIEDRAGNAGTTPFEAIILIEEPANPGIRLLQTLGSTTITEGGNTDTYSLLLSTKPTADVTITISADPQIILSESQVTFTADNWNIAKKITVAAVDDITPEEVQTKLVSHTISTADLDYAGISLADLKVEIADNDVSIQGNVWEDTNASRSQDISEQGLSGWTVYLDSNNNGQLDQGEIRTQTEQDGRYSFTDLRPGTYAVSSVVQTGWQQTYPTVTTTADSIELFTPSSPKALITGEASTAANQLIALNDFRNDARFSNITGKGYSAVIIDTGIDLDHPFFGPDVDGNGVSDRILYQYDFADKDADASDRSGHGSHVASVIGSSDNTYSGIAPDVGLIALKVFKDNGSGFFSDLEKSLQWVISNATTYNIASVNLSLGDERNWTTQTGRYGIGDELAALSAIGVVVAAAAGNNFAKFNSQPGVAYPAADINVISVGAVESGTDKIADFSQRHSDLLDVFAPGTPIAGADANGGIKTLSGTSQAAPYISGVVVLSQQIATEKLGRKLTTQEFNTLLATTGVIITDGDDEVDDVANTGLSFPRIDMLSLAEAILTLSREAPTTQPVTTDNNSSDAPLYVPSGISTTSHTVTLTPGKIVSDLNFGNQRIAQDNQLPELVAPIEDHSISLGDILSFTLPLATFQDADIDDILTYSAQLEDGSPLPEWIEFNAATLAFSGTPATSDTGSLNIRVVATDRQGAIAADVFTLTIAVTNTINTPPRTNTEIADQTTLEDAPFNFTLPSNTFIDDDVDDTLIYSVELEDGQAMPSWLSFDDDSLSFSGTPTNADVGSLNIRVVATDSKRASVSDLFTLTIDNVNDAPTVQTLIGTRTATRDTSFTFTVPTDTFVDIDPEDLLTYSAALADGSALPQWLTFEAATRTFNGTPAGTDLGLLNVKVTAVDVEGATAENSFELTVENPDSGMPESNQLTPVAEAKVLKVSRLSSSETISLQVEKVGTRRASELLVFSTDALGNNRTQLASFSLVNGNRLPSSYSSEFTLDSNQVANGEFLQFELIQNGKVRIATPIVDDKGQLILDFGGRTRLIAGVTDQPLTKNLLIDDAVAIDLTGETGPLNVQFTVYREAGFNNTVGFYTVDAADGSIQDLLTGTTLRPGEASYKAAALKRRLDVKLTGQNRKASNFSAEMAGGSFLGTFLIADGLDPVGKDVYFSYAGVNENNNDHVKILGNNTFGFEDLAGLGDRDFNDMVVQFSIA